jgi:hypothetical protein
VNSRSRSMQFFFATNRFADANWTGGRQPLSYKIREELPVIQEERSVTAAQTDASCSIPPGAPHGVARDRCGVFLASGKQFPSDQPTDRSLRRTLRQSNRLGQFLITHLNGSPPACLLGGEPYIDEEAGRSPIMPDQVTHQYVHDVII